MGFTAGPFIFGLCRSRVVFTAAGLAGLLLATGVHLIANHMKKHRTLPTVQIEAVNAGQPVESFDLAWLGWLVGGIGVLAVTMLPGDVALSRCRAENRQKHDRDDPCPGQLHSGVFRFGADEAQNLYVPAAPGGRSGSRRTVRAGDIRHRRKSVTLGVRGDSLRNLQWIFLFLPGILCTTVMLFQAFILFRLRKNTIKTGGEIEVKKGL